MNSSKNDKYLLVKGCAGLGNRLYTVSNAIEYCLKTNRKLIVDWSDGQFAKKGTNVFNEFFLLEKIEALNSIEDIANWEQLTFYPENWKAIAAAGIYDNYVVSESSFFNFIPYKIFPRGKSKMLRRYWQFSESTSIRAGGKPKGHLSWLLDGRNFPFGSDLSGSLQEDVVIFADFAPVYSPEIFLKHVKVKKNVEDKINKFAAEQNLNCNTIGLHIRSTDKKPTTTTEAVFNKIESLGLKEPSIFLATDNKFVLEEFQKKFPSLVTYPKFLPENTKDGLHQFALYNDKNDVALQMFEDSIADMWILSKCEYLLYQGNSSFSIISKILHRDKMKCLNWLDN